MIKETIRSNNPRETHKCYLQRGFLFCSAIRDSYGNTVYTLKEKGKGLQGKVIKIIQNQ